MKNGLLIWNAVLTLAAGYLLVTHFTATKTSETGTRRSLKDTTSHSSFRIAYFEMDSVENNFELVRKARIEIDEREKQFNNDVASLEWEKAQKLESYRRKTMTTDEIEKARMDMARQEDYVKEKKQELFQDLQSFINTKQLTLQNLIKEFLKEYNSDNKYAYIFAYDRGLYYYSDTAYNITGDVIAGLNEKYRKEAKK